VFVERANAIDCHSVAFEYGRDSRTRLGPQSVELPGQALTRAVSESEKASHQRIALERSRRPLAAASRAQQTLCMVIVEREFPSHDGRVAGTASVLEQQRVQERFAVCSRQTEVIGQSKTDDGRAMGVTGGLAFAEVEGNAESRDHVPEPVLARGLWRPEADCRSLHRLVAGLLLWSDFEYRPPPARR
jgi:hypothetical protein